jgi:hypothetical protein
MHARGAVWCFAQGPTTGGGCARTWGGPTRARTRVARGGFDSADTHEAVELPAGVAALHTALAKVDRDNLTHFVFVWLSLTRIWIRTARIKVVLACWPIHLSSPTKPPTKRPTRVQFICTHVNHGPAPHRGLGAASQPCVSHMVYEPFQLFHMSQGDQASTFIQEYRHAPWPRRHPCQCHRFWSAGTLPASHSATP